MTVIIAIRDRDGRFAGRAAATAPLEQARAIYQAYLAAVCRHQGLALDAVTAQLARSPFEARRGAGRPTATGGRGFVWDPAYKAAVYARQLALYLANVQHDVQQARLAEVTGLTPAAVCQALRAIEDLREIRSFDLRVDIVAAEMGAAEQASGALAVANGAKQGAC